jgi:hypothetical protein
MTISRYEWEHAVKLGTLAGKPSKLSAPSIHAVDHNQQGPGCRGRMAWLSRLHSLSKEEQNFLRTPRKLNGGSIFLG